MAISRFFRSIRCCCCQDRRTAVVASPEASVFFTPEASVFLERYFSFDEFKAESDDEDTKVARTIEIVEKNLPDGAMDYRLREWCTFGRVLLYLRGRDGNVKNAADILGKALLWRHEHQDVLDGTRVPRWSGDMRLIAIGEMGHPILYTCLGHKSSHASVNDEVEHIGAVLEEATRLMPPGVSSIDAVIDCHGFRWTDFMDPRPALATLDMLKHSYRNILRKGIIIDAPSAFKTVWDTMFYPVLPNTTRDKISFMDHTAAAGYLREILGVDAAGVVDRIIRGNRASHDGVPMVLPSEVVPTKVDAKTETLEDGGGQCGPCDGSGCGSVGDR